MDEKELLLRIIELLTRNFDNISAIERSVKSSQWSVYATLASAFVVFIVGLLNFRASMKMITSQNNKAYKEIITTERVKKYNSFRNACIDLIDCFLNGTKVISDLNDKSEQVKEYNKNLTQLNRCILVFYLEINKEEKDYIENDLNELKQIFMKYKEKNVYSSMLDKTRNINEKLKLLLDKRWEEIEAEAKI